MSANIVEVRRSARCQMDVSVQYVNPVKEGEGGPLWCNSTQGTSAVSSLAEDLGSGLLFLSMSAPPEEGHKACFREKDQESEAVILSQSEPLAVAIATNKEFGEDGASLNSKSMLAPEVDVSGEGKVSDKALDDHCSFESGYPAITGKWKKLPKASSKLISAMKGGRENKGICVGKLSVNWADDVYDPPATSQSHTVTNHKQHSSTADKKASRNKNKHKAKSSHKSGNEKKKSSRSSRNSSKVASY